MIDDEGNEILCSLPGKFKKQFHLKQDKQYILDIAAVGDRIRFSRNQDGSGVVNKILARKNYFSRKAIKLKGTAVIDWIVEIIKQEDPHSVFREANYNTFFSL